jgi:TonB family protein
MSRENIKEKAFSILVSLVFHVTVVFFLVKIVPPVRVFLYRQVADVRILSPEKVYYPRIAGLSEETGTSGGLPASRPPEESVTTNIEGVQQPAAVEPGVVYLKNMTFGRAEEKPDASPAAPSFDLIPSPQAGGGFSLQINRKKTEADETETKMDLSVYETPELSQVHFDRVLTRKGGRSSGQFAQDDRGQPIRDNIAPWVKGVVDKIRNTWIVPPIDESIAIGEVRIRVVFGKKGDLVSMAIMKSSNFETFDRTALGAIRSSAPFSPLPDDFPSARLEAFLVFQFNE